MCDRCIGVIPLRSAAGDVNVHVGYLPEADLEDRLLDGDVLFQMEDKVKRFTQEAFFEFFSRVSPHLESMTVGDVWGGSRPGGEPRYRDSYCAICRDKLVAVPALDADCVRCGKSKRDELEGMLEQREAMERQMEEFGAALSGSDKPMDIEQVFLSTCTMCVNGHYLCNDCYNDERLEPEATGSLDG